MKKLLAFLLSLALIVSLLPATLASAAAENENMKIVYGIATGTELHETDLGGNTDLYTDLTSSFYNGVGIGNINSYSKTGGFWYYYGSSSTAYSGNRVASYGAIQTYTLLGGWDAYNFYVPAAGTYNITVGGRSGSKGYPQGGHWSYSILDGGKTPAEITAAVSDVAWDATEEKLLGNAIGHLDCNPIEVGYDSNGNGNIVTDTQKVTFDEPGEYTLVLKMIEKATTHDENGQEIMPDGIRAQQIVFRGFSLTNGDGSKTVPMGFTAVDETSLKAGETTIARISGDLYGSNNWMKKNYDASEISFVSSDTSVATVSGSTVTAVGEGEAEISAVIDGATLHSATVSVKGENENVGLVYGIYGYKNDGTTLSDGTALYDDVLSAYWNSVAITTLNDYSKTGNTWKYYDSNSSYLSNCSTFYWRTRLYVLLDQWIAFKLNVPVAGRYDVTVKSNGNGAAGGTFAYTILDGDKTNAEITEAVSDVIWDETKGAAVGNCLGFIDNSMNNNKIVSDTAEKVSFPKAGDYILVLKTVKVGTTSSHPYDNNIFYAGVELKNGDGSKGVPFGTTVLSETTIFEGATATPTAKAYYSNDWTVYTGETVSFRSLNPDVATVVGNGIVAKKEGTAQIVATVDGVDLAPATLTVEAKHDPSPANTSIFVATNDKTAVPNSNITVTVGGAPREAGDVISAYKSALVKVVAPETVGNYRFKYWLGTGNIESFEPEYSFGNFTNKALLAVYEEIPAEGQATVTFYKQNKEIVDSKVVDKGAIFGDEKPSAPSLFGYTEFLGWFLGEDVKAEDSYIINKDTEVVALFDGAETITGITVDGSPVGDMSYGEKKTITSDNSAFSYWKRGDKIVSYDKSYTFAAWQDNAAFTAVNDGAVAAEVVAVLDERGDNYVLEYEIPADCKRREVGIIFGDNENITVDSCFAKAVSQTESSRGFFTAGADDFDYAKGYVIFSDANDVIRVAYSD